MTPLSENALEWIEKAKRDLDGASLMRKARYYDLSAFHCQQAAEKAVKGFLTFHDIRFAKNHDVKEHITAAAQVEKSFALWAAAGSFLTPFAVQSRYPGEPGKIDAKVCATAIKYANGIYEHVLSVLPKEINSLQRHKPQVRKKSRKR